MKTLNISNDLGIQRYVLTWEWTPHRDLSQEVLWAVCTALEARGEDILTNATNKLVIKGTRYCTTAEIRKLAGEALEIMRMWRRGQAPMVNLDLIIKSRNLSDKNDTLIKCYQEMRDMGVACPKMFRNDPKLSMLAHRRTHVFVSDDEIIYTER